MAEFMRPQVTVEKVDENTSRFIVEPLERGYGETLGNSLRRVLLSSLNGVAPTALRIEGVQHEFTTVPGVVDDVTDIVLNVKGLIFSAMGTGDEAVATLAVTGPGVATGADLVVPAEFNLINPEHVIATLSEGGELEMSIRIGTGRGYVLADGNKRADDPIGIIPLDSQFSPIRRCAMHVSDTRVKQRTDYSKLELEVETNGSIDPTAAICAAANIITQHMNAFLALTGEEETARTPSIFTPEGPTKNTELEKQIEDLDLSVRSYNCLKRAGIHSVRQLVEYSEDDLLNIRNFGAKSIEEVKDKLQSMNLNLK